MLTQSVRRVQPGKRILISNFAKPVEPRESELWLELGRVTGVFTEFGYKVRDAWKPIFTRHLAYVSV